jgi:hypothetical protein
LQPCRQQTGVTLLLPWSPLPQRIAGDLAQVALGVRR